MSFFSKLFGRKKEDNQDLENTDEEHGKFAIFVETKLPEFTYSELDIQQQKIIEVCETVLKDNIAPMLMFQEEPFNNPYNLDYYLTLWSNTNYTNFLGIDADQHAAFLAYNFGQYMSKKYGMSWQIKSDGYGTQTVLRSEAPIKLEIYPVDSTLKAIKNNKTAIYQGIESTLINAIDLVKSL